MSENKGFISEIIAITLALALGVLAVGVSQGGNLSALRILTEGQGGTGTSTPSGILYGNSGSIETVAIGSNVTFSGGTLSASGGSGNVATSSAETAGQLPYWTSTGATPATLGGVATTTATIGTGLSYSGTFGSLVGGVAGTLSTTLGTAIDAGEITAAAVDGDDVNSNIAGRSLTLTSASPDTLDADAELYTDHKCIWFEDPTADDDFESIWFTNQAVTITTMWCESDQATGVQADLQVDDGSPADVNGADLDCDTTPPTDTSMGGDATLAAGDRLDLAITSVGGSETWFSMCWGYTKDD